MGTTLEDVAVRDSQFGKMCSHSVNKNPHINITKKVNQIIQQKINIQLRENLERYI